MRDERRSVGDERPDLAAAAVGGPPSRLDGRIVLAPYDPTWPELFEAEAARIRAALGERALDLFHIGSTSVPGLSAKPIIDIILAVEDPRDEATYVPPLQAAGYTLRIREPDWFEHRLFKGEAPAVNLHVFAAGCEEIVRTLAFRDRLRADASDRLLYEQTKHALSARTWTFTQDYADAKSAVVAEILERAGV